MRKNWASENITRNVDLPSGKDSARMNVLSPGMDRAAQFIASLDEGWPIAKVLPRNIMGDATVYSVISARYAGTSIRAARIASHPNRYVEYVPFR